MQSWIYKAHCAVVPKKILENRFFRLIGGNVRIVALHKAAKSLFQGEDWRQCFSFNSWNIVMQRSVQPIEGAIHEYLVMERRYKMSP